MTIQDALLIFLLGLNFFLLIGFGALVLRQKIFIDTITQKMQELSKSLGTMEIMGALMGNYEKNSPAPKKKSNPFTVVKDINKDTEKDPSN